MSHVGKGDIHAYLDGALGAYPGEEADRIRRHLEECEECARSLVEERRVRQEASVILAASAPVAVEVAPFEELVAQARGREPLRPSGGPSSLRVFRTAAMVVVSLGAGWLARDLTFPARELGRGAALGAGRIEPATAEEGSARRQAVAASAANRLTESTESRDSETAVAPPADAPTTSVITPAELREPEEAGQGVVVEGESRPGPQIAPMAPTDELGTVTRERAVRVGVRPAAAPAESRSAAADRVTPFAVAERRLAVDPGVLADEANAMGSARMPVTGLASSFVIPGLVVRDVRVSALAETSVTIVQELPDGRIVELLFVGTTEDEAGRNVSALETEGQQSGGRDVVEQGEGLFEEPLREGWSRAERLVPGGYAAIRGPLGEADLLQLLDAAVAGR